MQSTASNSLSAARWKTVSGERGPLKTADWSELDGPLSRIADCNSSIAGAMNSISSRPSFPDSPACGFKPATAIRGEFSAGQTHCEIFHTAALGEKFRLSGEFKAGCVHPRFVNRTRYDGIEFAPARQRYGFFKCRRCGARGLDRRLA